MPKHRYRKFRTVLSVQFVGSKKLFELCFETVGVPCFGDPTAPLHLSDWSNVIEECRLLDAETFVAIDNRKPVENVKTKPIRWRVTECGSKHNSHIRRDARAACDDVIYALAATACDKSQFFLTPAFLIQPLL